MSTPADVKPLGLSQLRIVWAALLASQGIYAAILLGGVLEAPLEPPDPIMLPALGCVALFVAAASMLLPRYFLGQIPRLLTERDRGLREHGQAALFARAIQFAATPFIIGMALAEAVGIFGLVLGALGVPHLMALPFFALSVVLMLMKFPTERGVLEPLERALGQGR